MSVRLKIESRESRPWSCVARPTHVVLLNNPSSTSVCLASHNSENTAVEMMEMMVYQARILFVGGPANGRIIRLISELEAAGGGAWVTAVGIFISYTSRKIM